MVEANEMKPDEKPGLWRILVDIFHRGGKCLSSRMKK
jgi:hypothetical protein